MRRCASISHSITPTENRSARRSTASLCSCSGAMYASFPLMAPGPRLVRRRERLRDAEVDQLHLPVVGDEHVLRADVAVHDPERRAVEIGQLVRVLQAREHAGQDSQPQRQSQLLARPAQQAIQDARQRLAVEVLHRDRQLVVADQHLVGLDDVRVIEAQRQPRLVEEHRDEVRIGRQLGPDALEHRQPPRAGTRVHHRQQHLGHAAPPDLRDRLVAPVVRARGPGDRMRKQHVGAVTRPAVTRAKNLRDDAHLSQEFPEVRLVGAQSSVARSVPGFGRLKMRQPL